MAPGSPVRLRLATPQDDAAIADLLVDSYLRAYSKKMPEHVLHEARLKDLQDVASRRESGCVIVLVKWDQVIGTVTVLRPENPACKSWTPLTAELKYMALARDHQGRNLSRALITEAIHIAHGWRAEAICLFVPKGATGVARLYERHGFIRKPEGDRDLQPELRLEAYWKALNWIDE